MNAKEDMPGLHGYHCYSHDPDHKAQQFTQLQLPQRWNDVGRRQPKGFSTDPQHIAQQANPLTAKN